MTHAATSSLHSTRIGTPSLPIYLTSVLTSPTTITISPSDGGVGEQLAIE
jgi:hypothetical protein